MRAQAPIGVFDSGLGGLTVLSALAQALPKENFVYLGDTARVPYGARSAHIIQRYSIEDVEYLLGHQVKLIVIACNTATAHAEEILSKRYKHIPFVGVIQPGIDALLNSEQRKRVGIVGTHSTIKSGVYKQRILAKQKDMEVMQRACPLLVPLVEEAWIEKEITRLAIREYFSDFSTAKIEAVVLGCTHYPLLKATIQKEFPELCLVDSSEETAQAVKSLLTEEKLNCPEDTAAQDRSIRLYLTDRNEQSNALQKFLAPLDYTSIEEVRL